MNSPQNLITRPEDLKQLCQKLKESDVIAFDTEFVRETTFFPILGLIQVATEHEAWLVDPLALSKSEMTPLMEIFENPKILKILHAAQGDQECLYTTYGITARPTLDTAVAASLLGYGDNIGLAKLQKDVLGITLQKGHARTDWTARPLASQLLKYAIADVSHLVKLALSLLRELDSTHRRAWALELSQKWERKEVFQNTAEAQAQKYSRNTRLDRRSLAALQELLRWRESRAATLNIPRRRIADDDVLFDLAHVRPTSLDHLGTFRGLNKGELRSSGETLIQIFQNVQELPESDLPKIIVPDSATPTEARAIDLLQCFLKILADKHQITARHLVASDDLLPLVRKQFSCEQDFIDSGVLTPGSARLIGEDLLAILNGKKALSVKHASIVISDL